MNSNSNQTINSDYQELTEKLRRLEQRVAQLESERRVNYVPFTREESEDEEPDIRSIESDEEKLESNIGEYGLAWLGNIVLFFGIIFLVEYLRISGLVVISSIFGFAAVAGIFGLALYFRDSNPYMATIFKLNVYLLVFYNTLKLHFFTSDPIVADKTLGVILLLIVIAVLLSLSIRNRYTILAGLSLILLAVTAVLSDSTHFMLSTTVLISIIGMVLLYRFGWIYLVFLSIFLVYFTNLLWVINNPLMGHELQIITNHQSGFNYLFLVSAIFSLIALMPEKDESYSSSGIIGSIVFNGVGFVFMMTMYILAFFKNNYILPTASIAVYCMLYSIVLKVRTNWKITGAIYALFGFMALSVSIFGIYNFPRAYYLLAIQSFLVVSMAIWFKSKFIVIMNSLMYTLLLVLYLSTSDSVDVVNISFSLVALVTARTLNLAKDRLTISTVFIRNLYLVMAFFMVLYTLYHLIPNHFITLSWTLAAIVYFLLSLLLKNVKYRYMALGTMVSAALFLFMVDLARIELAYRVIALLFLGLISIGVSLYYNKKLKKKTEQ
jgi:hypothetical protein